MGFQIKSSQTRYCIEKFEQSIGEDYIDGDF